MIKDSQALSTKSIGNARELGGYICRDNKVIKKGLLLRSASLNNISDDDIDILLNDYNLSEIVDFRMDFEEKSAPDKEIKGVKNCRFDIIGGILDDYDDSTEFFDGFLDIFNLPMEQRVEIFKRAAQNELIGENMYITFLSSQSAQKGYRAFFKELLKLPENKSILFHCSQGKDRTGLAAMLILATLNVDEEIIINDYMLTNLYNEELINKEQMFLESKGIKGKELDDIMIAMDRVTPVTVTNAIKWINENYGSIAGYIKEFLGISEEEIVILQKKFTKVMN